MTQPLDFSDASKLQTRDSMTAPSLRDVIFNHIRCEPGVCADSESDIADRLTQALTAAYAAYAAATTTAAYATYAAAATTAATARQQELDRQEADLVARLMALKPKAKKGKK